MANGAKSSGSKYRPGIVFWVVSWALALALLVVAVKDLVTGQSIVSAVFRGMAMLMIIVVGIIEVRRSRRLARGADPEQSRPPAGQ